MGTSQPVSFLSGKRAEDVALTHHGKTPSAKGRGGPETTHLEADPIAPSSKSPLEGKIPQPVQEPVSVQVQTEVRPSVTQKDLS